MKERNTEEIDVIFFREVDGKLVCEHNADSTFKNGRRKLTIEDVKDGIGYAILSIVKSEDGYKLMKKEWFEHLKRLFLLLQEDVKEMKQEDKGDVTDE